MSTETDSFTHKQVRALGKRVHRMALSTSYGITEPDLELALERGVQTVLYTRRGGAAVRGALTRAFARDRDRYTLLAGPTVGFFAGSMRSSVEKTLREFKTDYLDVPMLFWLGKTSALRPAVLEELVKLRDEGKVRALGCSIHDRERAGKLAADSALDLFMVRYNAAHPGGERDIFPHLARRNPAVLAYTATAWRKLLKAPSGWTDKVPDAGDCYRFCLSSPHVDMVLTGPSSRAELEQNLAALERGPLSDDEMTWMRAFGARAHG